MNIALWIIAGLLAVAFLAGGAMKVIQPKEKLAASGFGFVQDFSAVLALAVLVAWGRFGPQSFTG
jgi:hypothetical protein